MKPAFFPESFGLRYSLHVAAQSVLEPESLAASASSSSSWLEVRSRNTPKQRLDIRRPNPRKDKGPVGKPHSLGNGRKTSFRVVKGQSRGDWL